ncbi:hypothetical protein Bp8pC_148 [Bacillus phage Bp8p-C]|uniref:Holin n=2 Tax=Agatevirus Bp8pC TaxID=1910937 RepID=A0A0A0PJB2_9CAUD|nr:membrane protein [Bacillus phage Bp8p-C]YP_009784448.1 hypothetical protein QLX39_gp200 [Bacillus phage Bp8p-T]AHJ87578.1 hypothetical protein Bp8pC_148 [Bacillus phage Bp8p-C]AHJ87789.1 hypothetical protein Bp8pT_148 [Bacillus phage Bp8p-T]
MLSRRQLVIKIALVVVAEAVAMAVTFGFSHYVYPIKYAMPIHILFGAALAVVIVGAYNRRLKKHKQRVEEEIKELTRVVLKQLPDDIDDK